MFRHLDIKLVVIAFLGLAAFGLVVLLQNFSLNNVPDENIVYINPTVGGIEDDVRPDEDIDNPDIAQGPDGEVERPDTELD